MHLNWGNQCQVRHHRSSFNCRRPVDDVLTVRAPFLPWAGFGIVSITYSDYPTQGEAHHESSSNRLPVGVGDRVRDRNLGLAHDCADDVSKGSTTPSTGIAEASRRRRQAADELDKEIDAALKADRWDEAIAKAEQLVALRTRAQGPRHFETANSEWRLKALRKVAPMPKEDRVAYQSPYTLQGQADALVAQGKYSQAQPLFEKALEIYRRLLTDDHPDTALGYDNVALNLNSQGKYAAAQPLYEKALAIRRRLLTDDHPSTATSYNNVAHNLNAQGKYAAAQPLFEKALEIRRRLLGVDHTDTAAGYNNLAFNLNAQGKYAAAQPFFERALEINRRLFTDDHPSTALSYNNEASNLNAQGKSAGTRRSGLQESQYFERTRAPA